jgi:transcriptional regulator with GAF, ATPase, and Fis domain
MSTSDALTGSSESGPQAERELRERLAFETFLADLALRFQRLPAEQLDEALGESLRGLVETLDVDRSSVQALSEDGASFRITHGFARPGVPPLEFGLQLATALPWYAEQVRRGRMLVFPRLPEGFPAEARAELAYVASSGMKSHIILPLVVDREIVGSLGIASFRRRREFPPDFLSRLELVASVFASALYRKRAETRLQDAQGLNRAVLESVASEIVVLDREGRIVAVNRAWETSARRDRVPLSDVRPGTDYLEILARASPEGVGEAAAARATGIRSVLSGEKERFEVAYTYPHSTGMLSYLLCATRLTGAAGGAVVVHTDVTSLERAKQDLERALQQVSELKERLQAENVVLQQEIRRSGDFEEIVGRSPALSVLLHQVRQVAATDAPVLVLGETGTGKDLVARAVHDSSPRRGRPIVTVNCAALPAALIESELFGYEKGAFTGAISRTLGRFEVADGGTILLDEVGELPLEVQAKLLRVLQTGEFERLGASKTLRTNVRLIAATNRDLEREVREGRFRADLFYRLSVFPLTLPSLRNRPDDIPLLVWHFIGRKQTRLGRHVERVPDRLMQAFRAYAWPGNIRELENVVERALILSTGRTLAIDPMFPGGRRNPLQPTTALLSDVERQHILDVLEQCGWRVAGKGNAAERLGLNRSTLLSRMKKLGIRRPT